VFVAAHGRLVEWMSRTDGNYGSQGQSRWVAITGSGPLDLTQISATSRAATTAPDSHGTMPAERRTRWRCRQLGLSVRLVRLRRQQHDAKGTAVAYVRTYCARW